MKLVKGDCLEKLLDIKDKSVDLVYLDLPFGVLNCKWDKKLDLKKLWIQLKRIARNDRTPFFFSCTTKYGFELYNNSPKGYFRWDLVWEKNKPTSFLSCRKLPMRKHEMIYCFAKKCPDYDLSYHSEYTEQSEGKHHCPGYGKDKTNILKPKVHKHRLPTSVLPPQEDHEMIYCFAKKSPDYNLSSHSEYIEENERVHTCTGFMGDEKGKTNKIKAKIYKDKLPTSILDVPSTWCKFSKDHGINHRTAKPVALMEFLLKYWTKEGDVVLDPTAGSGSMGIACLNMKRDFIGIEQDDTIFQIMETRLAEIT